MLTATAMVVVGMALALVLLVALWVSVRTWRVRRAEYLRRQQLLGSVLNAQIRREQGRLMPPVVALVAAATDVVGVSARAMLEAIVDGQSDVTVLAELARGRMRSKRAELERALEGRVRDHHRFLIAKHLIHIDFLDEQIADFDAQIATHIQVQPPLSPDQPMSEPDAPMRAAVAPPGPPETPSEGAPLTWEAAITIWDGIPGIGRRVAEQLVAELGVDMGQFPSAAHAASWAKLSPGNNVSAGKRSTSTIGKGNQWLRSTLIQAAQAAVKVKDSYLFEQLGYKVHLEPITAMAA